MKFNPLKLVGQVGATGALMAFIAAFGSGHAPAYQYFQSGQAMLKVAVSHASQRKDGCRTRTKEELAKLPPNMRSAQDCSRERVPVLLEVDLDGKPVLSQTKNPSGLSRDGAATFYSIAHIPAGSHTLTLRMRESGRADGFDFIEEHKVDVKSLDILVVEFSREEQRFILR